MLNLVVSTVMCLSLGAPASAVPVETAARPDATAAETPRAESQAPPAPTPAPAPQPPPAPPPSTRDRAPAARDMARARARVSAVQRHRGPWVEVAGEPLSGSFSGTSGDILELSNAAGDVQISAARGVEGRIVARRKAGGRTDAEARALLERMQLGISQHAQRVVVRPEPADHGSMYRLDYEISLPKGMGVDLKNVSGSVSLTDVAGDVRVEAMSGDITARGLSRLRSMRTMSGDIDVTTVTLVGEADIQTVSGDIRAESLKATSVTLGSVSGDIHLAGASCGRVQLRTVNGDIEFASPAVAGGRYEFNSHAGDIVVVPGVKSAGFEFEAQTFKGTVHTDEAGEGGGRRVSGRVGDGSAFFTLTTFAGTIHVKK